MSATISASIEASLREYVAARVESQMLTVEAAKVAALIASGLTFDAIREALIAKAMGDADWKAGLR